MDVYLEVGKKKAFAGAIEWPGWCRSGGDEEQALQALCDYGPRYAAVLRSAVLEFQPPPDASAFSVIERLEGDASTDFGAPGKIPSSDARPVSDPDLRNLQLLLGACWQAFDSAARSAAGKELHLGPRGGGRDLEKIIHHVLEAEAAYHRRLGFKTDQQRDGDPFEELVRRRGMNLEALASAAHGELPSQGPRGGLRWPPRYYVRRSAWHVLDHAWEIEDRIQE